MQNPKPKDIDRLIEESETRVREVLEKFETVSVLLEEVLLQLKEQRPKIENDPARLLARLEILKAANDAVFSLEEQAFTLLEHFSKRAEDVSSQVATEDNPKVKALLLENLSRITNQVTSLTDEVQRIKKARQRRSEELDPLMASINELMPILKTPPKDGK